ncbi:MAG: leucine-rich repeat protein [Muribaculaceae bacterium]|nr:leucine-rich repeat protein [Muribaculaceae bacterium]
MKNIVNKMGLLLSLLWVSLSTLAYDFKVDGVEYTITDLDNLECEVASWPYSEGAVIIPSEVIYASHTFFVRGIGDGAFARRESITSVYIPNSVKRIGNNAFSGCSNMATISLSNSISKMGYSAFKSCTSLQSIEIMGTLSEIEHDCFRNCKSLLSITLPNTIESIGWEAFAYCESLKSILIPNSVKFIGEEAFANCTSLENISLSNKLIRINFGLFHNCSSLRSLEIPGSVSEIIMYENGTSSNSSISPFKGCDSLKYLSFPESSVSLKVYENDFYAHTVEGRLKDETITDIYIDRPIDKKMLFPNLERLKLGSNMTYVPVGGGSSYDPTVAELNNLKSIECIAIDPPYLATLTNKQYMNIEVLVLPEALEAYKNAPSWKSFWNLQGGAGVNYIKDDSKHIVSRVSISGTPVDESYRGLVIVRYSDGTIEKIIE